MKSYLESKKRLLGEDSPFSELLQNMVNGMLEGEMESFMAMEKGKIKSNKRNGKLGKQVLSALLIINQQ